MDCEIKKYVFVPNYFDMHKSVYSVVYKGQLDVLGWVYDGYYDNDDLLILPYKERVNNNFYIPFFPDKYNYKIGDYVYIEPFDDEYKNNFILFEELGMFQIHKKYKIKEIINFYFLVLENDNFQVSGYIKFHDVKKV